MDELRQVALKTTFLNIKMQRHLGQFLHIFPNQDSNKQQNQQIYNENVFYKLKVVVRHPDVDKSVFNENHELYQDAGIQKELFGIFRPAGFQRKE